MNAEPERPGAVPSAAGPNRRAAFGALGVLALLVLAGLWLTGALGHVGAIEDCLASGRSNCAPVTTPAR